MGLLDRFRRAPARVEALDPDDPALVVVATAFDPAVADSAVLASSGADPLRPALVRHHLTGVAGRTAELAEQLDPSYSVLVLPDVVLVVRTEVMTAMGLAQERSRMAGLAQRLGGTALGWDALQSRGDG